MNGPLLCRDDWKHQVICLPQKPYTTQTVVANLPVGSVIDSAEEGSSQTSNLGRPIDNVMYDKFIAMCESLESFGCELYSVEELREKMMESSTDPENVYGSKQIQNLLKAKYGDDLFLANFGKGLTRAFIPSG